MGGQTTLVLLGVLGVVFICFCFYDDSLYIAPDFMTDGLLITQDRINRICSQ